MSEANATPEAAPAEAAAPVTGSPLASAPSGADTSTGTDTGTGADTGTATDSGTGGNDSISGEESGTDVVYDLKLPEGFEADPTAMSEFQTFAKANGLSNEAAQAAIDLYTKTFQAQVEQYAKAQTSTWNTTIDGWKGELAKDPDFSGDNMQKSLTVIGRAFDEYGAPGVREAFDLTGAGWNPAIVRTFYNMAKQLNEGTIVPGDKPGSAGGVKTPGQVFYASEDKGT